MARHRTHRPRSRGFTLTELMVAVVGGLIVAMAMFALARDSSRFYQRETRVGDATMGALVAFQRLSLDIQRAGYMASPNFDRDPRICRPPVGAGALPNVGALRIQPTGGLPGVFTDARNGVTPETIDILGNFGRPERFLIWGVESAGAGFVVHLQEHGPLKRLGYTALGAPEKNDLLTSLFPQRRLLRIVDLAGRHYYGIIQQAADTGGDPAITLAATPGIVMKLAGGQDCGVNQLSIGTANVVNIIRYELRPIANVAAEAPGYAPLYPANPTELGKFDVATRTELVRYELEADGVTPRNETMEVVAEYGVDLRFGVTAITGRQIGLEITPAGLTSGAMGATGAWTGPLPAARPDQIRTVRARLSVRSEMPDRYGPTPPDPALAPGLYRFFVGSWGTRDLYARVRTIQADIGLRNLEPILWP